MIGVVSPGWDYGFWGGELAIFLVPVQAGSRLGLGQRTGTLVLGSNTDIRASSAMLENLI
jgi:hypothetical protein